MLPSRNGLGWITNLVLPLLHHPQCCLSKSAPFPHLHCHFLFFCHARVCHGTRLLPPANILSVSRLGRTKRRVPHGISQYPMEGKPTNLHPLEHGKVAPRLGRIAFSSFDVSDGIIIRASDVGWRPPVLRAGSYLPIVNNRLLICVVIAFFDSSTGGSRPCLSCCW